MTGLHSLHILQLELIMISSQNEIVLGTALHDMHPSYSLQTSRFIPAMVATFLFPHFFRFFPSFFATWLVDEVDYISILFSEHLCSLLESSFSLCIRSLLSLEPT